MSAELLHHLPGLDSAPHASTETSLDKRGRDLPPRWRPVRAAVGLLQQPGNLRLMGSGRLGLHVRRWTASPTSSADELQQGCFAPSVADPANGLRLGIPQRHPRTVGSRCLLAVPSGALFAAQQMLLAERKQALWPLDLASSAASRRRLRPSGLATSRRGCSSLNRFGGALERPRGDPPDGSGLYASTVAPT